MEFATYSFSKIKLIHTYENLLMIQCNLEILPGDRYWIFNLRVFSSKEKSYPVNVIFCFCVFTQGRFALTTHYCGEIIVIQCIHQTQKGCPSSLLIWDHWLPQLWVTSPQGFSGLLQGFPNLLASSLSKRTVCFLLGSLNHYSFLLNIN